MKLGHRRTQSNSSFFFSKRSCFKIDPKSKKGKVFNLIQESNRKSAEKTVSVESLEFTKIRPLNNSLFCFGKNQGTRYSTAVNSPQTEEILESIPENSNHSAMFPKNQIKKDTRVNKSLPTLPKASKLSKSCLIKYLKLAIKSKQNHKNKKVKSPNVQGKKPSSAQLKVKKN